MADLGFERMQQMQRALQEKYCDKWEPVCPATGRNKLLWMMIEAGEAADVIKKKGDGNIMSDAVIRKHFIEEMCDTLMYFNDVMICYGITPDELEAVYTEKQETNMTRW